MSTKIVLLVALAAGVGWYLYTKVKVQGVAQATAAANTASGTQTPSGFVTARNNLEMNIATGATNALSNWGF